jgi:hypothetical protein
MTVRRAIAVLVFLLSLVAVGHASAAEQAAPTAFDDRSAFEALKSLAGTWEGTAGGEKGQPVTTTYRVTSHGSAVVEDLFPGTPHEMLTVYYMDGEHLVLTHYCALGNQPRMRFEKSGRPGEIRFVFDGGTNVRPGRDEHMHEATIRLVGQGRIESDWVSWKGGARNESERFSLTRKG